MKARGPRPTAEGAGGGRQGGERPDRDNGAHRAANADTMSRRQQTRRTRSDVAPLKRAPPRARARTAGPVRGAPWTVDGSLRNALKRGRWSLLRVRYGPM